ncbi:hypothetical protein CMO89_04555 [Candidatus Woesearchaeota archaeon]|nr:hypothetical protein [Candidatus Woesearchaeota archaeon]MAG08721.1 hypothetical protein [Candidatus Woesearchaeota archaeon]|tara:strand:+ start:257 stop:1207 length:951 start_codon:yes stop_codon:yes gene_type:complete
MTEEQLTFDKEHLLGKYAPLDFVMAYGSGVFRQAGYEEQAKPMVDFIFGVDSTYLWHLRNLKKNTKDYSPLVRILGAEIANWLQERGAKIYYNPYIPFEEQEIKYGVISLDSLLKDLRDWDTLYVAGRLHKPVKILKSTEHINQANSINLNHAFNTALLLLPETFTEEELYTCISRISYTGDSRMKHGENPQKAENIVTKNMKGFHDLYEYILLGKNNTILSLLNDSHIQQDKDPKTIESTYFELPSNLIKHAIYPINFHDEAELQENIRNSLTNIISASSTSQTIKGLFTAGVPKSIRYVKEKMNKHKQSTSSPS